MTRDRRRAPRDTAAPSSASSTRIAALRLLGRRDHTAVELRERLIARGHPAEEVGTALERLQDEGLLDDRRFAEAYVRTASRLKGRGRLRIERELVARGVDRSLAADLVRGVSEADEAAALERLLVRRRPAGPGEVTAADERRLYQQLRRRGFAPDAIAAALRRRRQEPDTD